MSDLKASDAIIVHQTLNNRYSQIRQMKITNCSHNRSVSGIMIIVFIQTSIKESKSDVTLITTVELLMKDHADDKLSLF